MSNFGKETKTRAKYTRSRETVAEDMTSAQRLVACLASLACARVFFPLLNLSSKLESVCNLVITGSTCRRTARAKLATLCKLAYVWKPLVRSNFSIVLLCTSGSFINNKQTKTKTTAVTLASQINLDNHRY